MNNGNTCFLQALFGQSCKTFLDIIASPNWTKLQRLYMPIFFLPPFLKSAHFC